MKYFKSGQTTSICIPDAVHKLPGNTFRPIKLMCTCSKQVNTKVYHGRLHFTLSCMLGLINRDQLEGFSMDQAIDFVFTILNDASKMAAKRSSPDISIR